MLAEGSALPSKYRSLPLISEDLFAAGVISLQFQGNHETTPRSVWLNVEGSLLIRRSQTQWNWSDVPTVESKSLAKAFCQLVNFRFIQASYRWVTSEMVYIRIYIIPRDLPGELRHFYTLSSTQHTEASKSMRLLLDKTTRASKAWATGELQTRNEPFFNDPEDNRSLAEIFSSLPSPTINASLVDPKLFKITQSLWRSGPPGMESTLYPYQSDTVHYLLERELCPGLAPDASYVSITSMESSRVFFLQPSTLAIRSEVEQYDRPPGGILAEELGMGKTVMIIALILCTRDDLPSLPQSSEYTYSGVLTHSIDPNINSSEPPSLLQFALHKARTSSLPYHTWDTIAPHLRDALCVSIPFCTRRATSFPGSTARRATQHEECRIYLSSTTLVAAPTLLIEQWRSEIMKHVHPEHLRVLTIINESDLPKTIEDLASNYDIILMTHLGIYLSIESTRVWRRPRLFPIAFSKILEWRLPSGAPSDHRFTNNSPAFFYIRWKRLVIDEGDNCASKWSNLVKAACELDVERRWIVTGTPTNNLVGGNVGTIKEPTYEDPLAISSPSLRRVFTAKDRTDLNELGWMTGEVLALLPYFRTMEGGRSTSLFTRHVTGPLCPQPGMPPLFGAVRVLSAVMAQSIIRHRPEDIEHDVQIAPYTHETVLLDLDEYAAKTYNVMQTVIAVNAVDSDRIGEDYLFSPVNTAHLQTLSKNISQSLFWHIDTDTLDIDRAIRRCEEAIKTGIERGANESDIQLLQESLAIQQHAAKDSMWRSLMGHITVPHRLEGLPPLVQDHWPSYDHSSLWAEHDRETCPYFMQSTHLARLRHGANKTADCVDMRYLLALGDITNHTGDDPASQPDQSPSDFAKAKPHSITRLETKLGVSLKSQSSSKHTYIKDNDAVELEVNNKLNTSRPDAYSDALDPQSLSSLSSTRIGNSGSSKLDYILSEVLRYSTDEKFIIFSDSPLTLAYVAEGLDVVSVPHVEFAPGTSRKEREQLIITFRTSDAVRVLLMELKDGARGLNITEASRIIFCEPVWALDVERQAIKRAHRIGQTRPITVKTLAIRATIEEEMMIRRTNRTSTKVVLEDEGIRGWIKNPRFIRHRLTDMEALRLPLIAYLDVSGLQDQETAKSVDVRMDESVAEMGTSRSSPKRKRAVAFAKDTEVNDGNRRAVRFKED